MNKILLTPGPLTTSQTVKEAMLVDSCTWDDDYKKVTQSIRKDLLQIAGVGEDDYTAILMQGSGTFGIEAMINTIIKVDEKSLILVNGAYGQRIVDIAIKQNKKVIALVGDETKTYQIAEIENVLIENKDIKYVFMVHCETTTGILNNLEEVASLVKKYHKIFMIDAMSSFGGIPIDLKKNNISGLVSSSNKCLQGVPGFSFVIIYRDLIKQAQNNSTSLALDLFEQWECFEKENGKWRFTSPTHVVNAFRRALDEFKQEGGLNKRFKRYQKNQKLLVELMKELGFKTVLDQVNQSPIITTFYYPNNPKFTFKGLYDYLKERNFIIYPGKLSRLNIFRIGNIGEVSAADIRRLVKVIQKYLEVLK